jgi:CTP synthase
VLDDWRKMINRIRAPREKLRIGVVGKYVELHDAYMSVKEALYHAGNVRNRDVEISWIYSGDLEKDKGWDEMAELDGIVVPGGFGERGIEGKILAARYARERKIPYLGLCLGMQVMCIEFARNVLDLEDANSSEFAGHTPNAVIDLMDDQRSIAGLGGTMRLGLYPCRLEPDTIAARAYGAKEIQERHRHRFEFNNTYRSAFQQKGMVFSGLSPDRNLVEIAEIKDHPFMLGSQFHPEFLSRPNVPHPLFLSFVDAVIEHEHSVEPVESENLSSYNGHPADTTEVRNT